MRISCVGGVLIFSLIFHLISSVIAPKPRAMRIED